MRSLRRHLDLFASNVAQIAAPAVMFLLRQKHGCHPSQFTASFKCLLDSSIAERFSRTAWA